MDAEQRAAALARIDERTESMMTIMEKHSEALVLHEERDRQDFKEVHSRISRVERKQNWMIGVGTTSVVVVGFVVSFARKMFTGGI